MHHQSRIEFDAQDDEIPAFPARPMDDMYRFLAGIEKDLIRGPPLMQLLLTTFYDQICPFL